MMMILQACKPRNPDVVLSISVSGCILIAIPFVFLLARYGEIKTVTL
jgi:hypothetical protein